MKTRQGYVLIVAMVLTLFVSLAVAQENKSETKAKMQEDWNFYKLDFVVRELEDGKTVNTRNYTMITRSNDWQQLRVGTKVPLIEDKKINYFDVGLKIDCRISEDRDQNTALITKAEIASIASSDQEKIMTGAPLIRQVQMNTSAPLTLGKAVVISGVDELNSKHRFQLEVTATKAK